MTWPRPKHVRTRLTLWYVFVLSALLIVCIAGTSFILVWQMHEQLKRHIVQDLETVEGLLYFSGDGQLPTVRFFIETTASAIGRSVVLHFPEKE